MTTSPALDAKLAEDGPAISGLRPGMDPISDAAAGQWTLIWRKFLGQKVAVFCGGVILALYLVGAFAEFLAPGLPDTSRAQYTYAPPQSLGLFTPEGEFQLHVKGYTVEIDKAALKTAPVAETVEPETSSQASPPDS